MPKASDLKRGIAVEYNGKLLLVKHVDVHSPSARGAATLYKTRFADITTGGKVEHTFKGDDMLTQVDLSRHPVMFIFLWITKITANTTLDSVKLPTKCCLLMKRLSA